MKVIKRINDPVLGVILIDDKRKWVCELLESFELQRLRQIYQLGCVSLVYPGATVTRFSHSLGTFEIARRMLDHLSQLNDISLTDQNLVLCAALLHDLGHAAHSHSFEYYFNTVHEEYSVKIIKNLKGNILPVLNKYQIDANEVCNLIQAKHQNMWMNQIISSAIDADRLDYLRRDSYYLGVNYFEVRSEDIIEKMKLVEGKIIFTSEAVPLIEKFLMGRMHLFQYVYQNSKVMSFETLVEQIIRRFETLIESKYKFKESKLAGIYSSVFENSITIEKYLQITDTSFNFLLNSFVDENDAILSRLASHLSSRKTLTVKSYSSAALIEPGTWVLEKPIKRKQNYYFFNPVKTPIYIEVEKNVYRLIEEVSPIAANSQQMPNAKTYLIA